MKIVIVIPTYNEADNIGRLADVLQQEFLKRSQHDFHILVVEGNSPDGTAEVVREKMKNNPNIHLLMEKVKAGLGAAYVYGFKEAMNELKADVIVEMDADFQHDPKDVVRIVDEIDNGYDYVIGSRFTKGGSIPDEWAFKRKFFSVGGNIFSKIVLGIFDVNDFTSGFKASRVKGFVDKLPLEAILSQGFAYKIDLLFKMHRLGAKIKEVPIKFGLRDRGDSKMEKNNLRDSLRVVVTLRYNENKNFVRFLVVGGIGFIVDAGLFNIFRISVLSSRDSAVASGFVAMIVTFLLNNYWSFGERKIDGVQKKVLGFILYIVSSFIPIAVRSRLVGFSVSTFGDTALVSNTAFLIGIIFGLIWNFTVYSKIIWKVNKR
ncbi:MAG: Dolichyl-phosphate beta-D-mannosyltransferase [candidate division WWE3 bacterium GW2011_GWF2_41_45]|uniref:Dolichyl-phosphate beta-D-mannosyltransferase n=3 Tax=Katanobacteria TaxID=422282 RepID=A0A1F4W3I4_UNCKA|nr:MAG: Dolichyl-phosphate beta-D-mannosyltransferase [candidate division WWE3 bacterium GW2011_GWC2_41_23]KKS10775.1 MAG: Dolichyl-phosphate beta-D-mannosyltransferase [candidate division WWE3 bacterium GW2011_GWF2_41_45]KKS12451.1 MAG: Dolichyl-phosphate beta-D-mannosyltransferase [candidate division WWE3 bacterium GW2011_GWF1_41_53]KKS20170.1 MAG: Dolichyl-phosphate beta-D-mannosyltransferase [candidate division WWE3 bacterium GW2011_GWE1_41_72]KKS28392.1 MAG: Dolichyl-phosphate beta-D-manno